MVTRRASGEQIRTWKDAWLAYRDKIPPGRKTGAEIILYLQNRYVLTETFDGVALAVIKENVVRNECNAEKLPPGEKPRPRAFFVENEGAGERLYRLAAQEDAGWDTDRIFVGVDAATGYFYVEGSEELWDELFVYRGLDELDLRNFALTGQYVDLCRRRGLPLPD